MTDEQTAAAIVADSRNACDETAMEAAIVKALRQAREEGVRKASNVPPPYQQMDRDETHDNEWCD